MTPEQPFASPVPGVPPTTPSAPDPSMPVADPYAQAMPVNPYAGAVNQPQPVADPYAQPMASAQPMMGPQPMPEMQPAMGAVPMEPAMGATPMEATTQPVPNPSNVGPTITQAPTAQVNNPITAAPAAMPPAGVAPEPVKKKSKLPLIIGIIVGLAAVIGVVILIISLLGGVKEVTVLEDIGFFLPDSKGDSSKYALFNGDGDKLTDFEYVSVAGPVGGYAVVTNTNNESGIINVKGEMTVKYGKYDSIFSRGALYEATSGDSAELITAMGKKVLSLEEGDKASTVAESYFTIVHHKDGKNEIYDIKGNKVDSFESSDDKFALYAVDDIASVGYSGGLIVLNNKEMTVRKKYDAKLAYGVTSTSQDLSYMVVHTDEEEYSQNKYGLIIDDKLYDLADKCYRVVLQYSYELDSRQNVAYCEDEEYDDYLIHSDGTVDSKDTSNYIYFSEKDYVYNDREGNIIFYNDGQKVKTITKKYATAYETFGYVSVHDYGSDGTTTLYDKSGTEIVAIKGASLISGVDPNGNIVVSGYQSGKGHSEYLADKTGKKLSSDYYNMSYVAGDYYRALKNSSESGYILVDKTGKELTTTGYKRLYYSHESHALFGIQDYGEYDLLDKDGKVLAELRGDEVYDYDNMIVVELANGGRQFYTYSGKKFHEYGN